MARNSLFKTKSIDSLMAQTEESGHKLKRALGAFDLTLLGIGGIIGTGIFVLTGVGAALHAGPAITPSFVISGLACVFAALCYAEFASMIPVAGSAYTYSYATLGELYAWFIGWDLILLFNGVLFGLLSVLAILGATAIRYWEEVQFVHLEPHHGAIYSGIAAAVGLALLVAGRAMPRNGRTA